MAVVETKSETEKARMRNGKLNLSEVVHAYFGNEADPICKALGQIANISEGELYLYGGTLLPHLGLNATDVREYARQKAQALKNIPSGITVLDPQVEAEGLEALSQRVRRDIDLGVPRSTFDESQSVIKKAGVGINRTTAGTTASLPLLKVENGRSIITIIPNDHPSSYRTEPCTSFDALRAPVISESGHLTAIPSELELNELGVPVLRIINWQELDQHPEKRRLVIARWARQAMTKHNSFPVGVSDDTEELEYIQRQLAQLSQNTGENGQESGQVRAELLELKIALSTLGVRTCQTTERILYQAQLGTPQTPLGDTIKWHPGLIIHLDY